MRTLFQLIVSGCAQPLREVLSRHRHAWRTAAGQRLPAHRA
ncbi:hypothetical protein PXO_05445 [Xanthomonas oryzae pv. oryzae PXO99A]|uniref:Uncharacterized protein n=1 Tax=Xanthomonas oryzae pv. oryzae (strain PXO99A) TaxID=360094 RepID=A0A0K0GGG6_XANOP|nr:hypothetical protein PXO_05445 [Xanthomonas oryzae pv. oryzae PXO99A]